VRSKALTASGQPFPGKLRKTTRRRWARASTQRESIDEKASLGFLFSSTHGINGEIPMDTRREDFEDIRRRLNEKISQLNSGIDIKQLAYYRMLSPIFSDRVERSETVADLLGVNSGELLRTILRCVDQADQGNGRNEARERVQRILRFVLEGDQYPNVLKGEIRAVMSLAISLKYVRPSEVKSYLDVLTQIYAAQSRAVHLIRTANYELVDNLSRWIDEKSKWTRGHSERVARLCRPVGLKLTRRLDPVLELGAKLHDIGKVDVPNAILDKKGRLSEEEFITIQRHTEVGYEILSRVPFLVGESEIALNHHEPRYRGKTREEVSLQARIVSVVDIFDAIASNRPYRPWRSMKEGVQEAIKYLREGIGRPFDEEIVNALLDTLAERPEIFEDETREFSDDAVAQITAKYYGNYDKDLRRTYLAIQRNGRLSIPERLKALENELNVLVSPHHLRLFNPDSDFGATDWASNHVTTCELLGIDLVRELEAAYQTIDDIYTERSIISRKGSQVAPLTISEPIDSLYSQQAREKKERLNRLIRLNLELKAVNPLSEKIESIQTLLTTVRFLDESYLEEWLNEFEKMYFEFLELNNSMLMTNVEMLHLIDVASSMRSPYNCGNSDHRAAYAVAMAAELGVPREEIINLRDACFLCKGGYIVEDQAYFELQKTNPLEYGYRIQQAGAQLVAGIEVFEDEQEMVRYMRERYDGSGYCGLKGEMIPLGARILAVADTFEYLTGRLKKGDKEAVEEICRRSGKDFDPKVVAALYLAVYDQETRRFDRQKVIAKFSPCLRAGTKAKLCQSSFAFF